MTFVEILTLAVGLAMDATAVAAARGLAAPIVTARQVVMVGACFGGAQALMPLLGGIVGERLGPVVARWDHWIAFTLLTAIGLKILWDALGKQDRAPRAPANPFGLRIMLVLALATSIDAFAVGITLPLLEAPFALSLVTIGVTTALLSGAAVVVGRRLGARLGRGLHAFGGLVLIGLGLKTLLAHLAAG